MKVATNGARRAATQLRLLAVLLTVGAAIAAAPSGARAGSGPDLQHEGLRAEGLRPEGLVSGLRANGAHVLSLGSRGGLDAYFVTPAKSTGYSLYVTEDGHAVAGLLYGPDGAELTGAQLAAARDKGETTAAVVAHAERGSVVRPSSSASFTEAVRAQCDRLRVPAHRRRGRGRALEGHRHRHLRGPDREPVGHHRREPHRDRQHTVAGGRIARPRARAGGDARRADDAGARPPVRDRLAQGICRGTLCTCTTRPTGTVPIPPGWPIPTRSCCASWRPSIVAVEQPGRRGR